MKEALLGKTLSELQLIIRELALPEFTALQIADWLYVKRAGAFGNMTNLSKKARALLEERYETGVSLPRKLQVSSDGTKKYLFETGQGSFIETAVIPDKERITVCVSSQAGCKLGCLFCMTGKQGFQGQLTAGQIINQLISIEEAGKITNIVYMGMGEPLDNPDEVLKSIQILTAPWGFAMSPSRITVSTVGILPQIRRFLEESKAHLAISLHSPYDEERRYLMPVQAAYPVSEVIREIRNFSFSQHRRISFEYIVFKNLNHSRQHVWELARLLQGLNCRINLIRYHPVPGIPLECIDEPSLSEFKNRLNEKGILTTVRVSRGVDIFAACGLLSTKEMVKNSGK